MNQKSVTEFTSKCGKSKIYVENDMPIGVFHDFLMEMKGIMVDRMVDAHKQQIKEMEDHRNQEEKSNQEDLNHIGE